MSGIRIEKKNGNLVITAPIDKALPLSNSGKSRMVCSTHGNVPADLTIENAHKKTDNNLIISLNCYVRTTDKEALERQAAIAGEKAKNAE